MSSLRLLNSQLGKRYGGIEKTLDTEARLSKAQYWLRFEEFNFSVLQFHLEIKDCNKSCCEV